MKTTVLCALVALIPSSLIAAERITIQARFIEASPNTRIPHDLVRLNQTRGVRIITPPRAITKLGREAKIKIIQEFWLHLPYGPSRNIPMGVVLTVTPYRYDGQLAYRASLISREFDRRTPKGAMNVNKQLNQFTSRELYLSGTSKDGKPVWFDFTIPNDGRKFAVSLEFNRKDA